MSLPTILYVEIVYVPVTYIVGRRNRAAIYKGMLQFLKVTDDHFKGQRSRSLGSQNFVSK